MKKWNNNLLSAILIVAVNCIIRLVFYEEVLLFHVQSIKPLKLQPVHLISNRSQQGQFFFYLICLHRLQSIYSIICL